MGFALVNGLSHTKGLCEYALSCSMSLGHVATMGTASTAGLLYMAMPIVHNGSYYLSIRIVGVLLLLFGG